MPMHGRLKILSEMGGAFCLRPVTEEDFVTLRPIFDQGRLFQNSLGFEQWLEGYPSESLLRSDLERGYGMVIESDGRTIGYLAIVKDGDKEYDRLGHIWKLGGPYAVVHRFVLSDEARGAGLSGNILNEVERMVVDDGIDIMRIDTGLQNKPMHNLMAKAAYTNLGDYTFVWGQRYAYEKLLNGTRL